MKKKKEKAFSQLISAEGAGLSRKAGVPGTVLGMLCRYAVAVCGAFGVCLMLENAFSLAGGDHPALRVLLFCSVITAVTYLIFTAAHVNRAFLWTVIGLTAAAVVIIILKIGIKRFFYIAPVTAWNQIIKQLADYGYTSLRWLIVSGVRFNPSMAANSGSILIAFIQFAVPVCLAFSAGTFGKPRVVPVVIAAGVVMTVTFTYNLLSDSYGFLFAAASGFGVLFLKYHSVFLSAGADPEKGFAARRRRLASYARSGFAALTAAALIIAAGIYPAAKIDRPAPELTVFNDMMDRAREFVYTIITPGDGGGPVMIDPDRTEQTVEPSPRSFRNKTVMTVKAPSTTPLYLRAWIGGDYTGDTWEKAASFGGVNSEEFIPEDITELFYEIVDSQANKVPMAGVGTENENRGFIKEVVTMESRSLKSVKGYLPSRFAHKYGVGTAAGPAEKYPDYDFDIGVGTVRLPMGGAEYSAAAYAQNYKSVSLARLDRDMAIYRIVYPHVREYLENALFSFGGAGSYDWKSEIRKIELEAGSAELSLSENCIIYRLEDMSLAEKKELFSRISDVEEYEARVGSVYGGTPWSDDAVLKDACSEIMNSINDPDRREYDPSGVYTFADRTARYLSRLCTYSTDPKGYTPHGGSYVSQFLTTARNGYCVQYATAAALILRTAGYPARYAEGFIATNFTRSGGLYVCSVKDSNAHAWVEVYVYGYGWMTFEMTGPMMSGMYPANAPVVDPEETDPPRPAETTAPQPPETETRPRETTEPPVTTEPVTTVIGGGGGKAKTVVVAVVAAVAALFVLSTALYLYLRTVNRRRRKLDALLKRAAKGGSSDPVKDTALITEYIGFLFSAVGMKRAENELMADFVKRANGFTADGSDFTAAADAIQKNEFGHASGREDCAETAKYALRLRKTAGERLKGFKKFYYVRLRKLI